MTHDPFAELKQKQRQMWASFGPTALFTSPPAAKLVRFAGIAPGQKVLDVATGTGVVAITAARAGARVSALDLTPELLVEARRNGELAEHPEIEWTEGDAERLPYPDASFDVVLSQFGHMFAPRPEVAVAEMRRVLRPGGLLAFSTWPPEHWVGKFFAFVARHTPPPPGVPPVTLWGEPRVIAERLGAGFEPPFFERAIMVVPSLSPGHLRAFFEGSVGPMTKLVEALSSAPEKLEAVRAELEALAAPYYRDNELRQDFLMTRARAR